jgi:hypothetical protein
MEESDPTFTILAVPGRRVMSGLALALACALAPGCGGGGGTAAPPSGTTTATRLSPSAYRARLALAAKEANKGFAEVDKALKAKSVAEIQRHLQRFGRAQDQLGDEVGALNPPANAEAANAELARGEHDTASEVRSVLPKLAKFSSTKAALAFLNKQLGSGSAKGGREVDQAIARLRKLGYTKGS